MCSGTCHAHEPSLWAVRGPADDGTGNDQRRNASREEVKVLGWVCQLPEENSLRGRLRFCLLSRFMAIYFDNTLARVDLAALERVVLM